MDTEVRANQEKKEWDAAGRIAITWAEQYLRTARILILDRDMRTYSRERLRIVNEAIMKALDLAVAVGNLQGAFVYWKYPRESKKKH